MLLSAAGCALLIGAARAQIRGDHWYECAPMGRQYAFDDLIIEAAARHQVEPALLKTIVWQESRFDPAKVHDGGYGLMQIGKGTGMEWAAVHHVENFMMSDLLDARTNLHAGAWYVRQLLDHWRGADDPTMFALAEYVAGRQALQQWACGSLRAETLRGAMEGTAAGQFVDRVLKRMRMAR